MSICVTPAALDSESSEVCGLLQANLPAISHEARFDWLYRANPDGPAWCWLARQDATGELVGVTSLFPRSMWVGGRAVMCGQVGDFAVSAGYRSLGPALLMQRATMEPVDTGALAFCYDCPPHEAGMATFRRLGLKPSVAMNRYVLLMRVERHLEKRFGFAPPFVSKIGNFLLRSSCTGRASSARGLHIDEHTGPFGDEFSCLDDSLKDEQVIRSRRSSAHLNWRYRQDPLNQYRVLTARHQGELVAFLIFSEAKESLVVLDLFGTGFPQSALALLERLREHCDFTIQRIEAYLSEGNNAVAPLLEKCYRPRGIAAQIVAYAIPGGEMDGFLNPGARWSFQAVDIRV
jgi:hypothetical protein